MVEIQLVTVEGCKEPSCETCETAERTLRRVLELLGVPLPVHAKGHRGEHFLSGEDSIQAVHLRCDQAGPHLSASGAPYLLVDGDIVMANAGEDPDRLARAVLASLRPHGLADLRP